MVILKWYFLEFEKEHEREAAYAPLSGQRGLQVFRLSHHGMFVGGGGDLKPAIKGANLGFAFRMVEFPLQKGTHAKVSHVSQALPHIGGLCRHAEAYAWRSHQFEELSRKNLKLLCRTCEKELREVARVEEGVKVGRAVTRVAAKVEAEPPVARTLERQGGDIRINGRVPTPEEKEKMKLNRRLA